MYRYICLVLVISLGSSPDKYCVSGGGAPGDTVVISSSSRYHHHPPASAAHYQQQQQQVHHSQQPHGGASGSSGSPSQQQQQQAHYHHQAAGSGHADHRSSYNLLSEAMSQAVSHEFSTLGSGSADGACHVDDLDCYSGNIQDRLGMEAIRTLHRQLDDDDNGNIDLSESDDFLREELKYDSGYEKRQKAFHFNDDMHISVKELWEAWLRSEVHNWTIEQTTDWLAQSVQLPQYVELFKQHKVTGAALPRLAVNNMHYVSNVLGIKDPIHKQKIALKAMDVVLFGPPRETGTRWKDYILVTLLLSAIIGCWYAYQQNKNAKRHLKRMAQDMEGLQKAEQSLQEMQKELERARLEQENVATEKLDLERRLKEAPLLSASSSDLEVQQLKQEIEMLRSELSRAEVELDHCWSPPPQLTSWLQYTYELESKNHQRKRLSAEKQLQAAREACEKLRKKRSSIVGVFATTHGKSIDDVDRSIVEARNALSEVTAELQERLHRWKQIEMLLGGANIVNNIGLSQLENVLYNRNGNVKSSRGRIANSTDDLDDDSVQGMIDSYGRGSSVISGSAAGVMGGSSGGGTSGTGAGAIAGGRDDSSNSDDGDTQSVQFYLGGAPTTTSLNANRHSHLQSAESLTNLNLINSNHLPSPPSQGTTPMTPTTPSATNQTHNNSQPAVVNSSDSTHNIIDDSRHSPSVSSERSLPIPPRAKKPIHQTTVPPPPPPNGPVGRTPVPPPRRANQSHIIRSQSTELVPLEFMPYHSLAHYQSSSAVCGTPGSPFGLYQQHYPAVNKHTYQNVVQSASNATTPSTPSSVSSATAFSLARSAGYPTAAGGRAAIERLGVGSVGDAECVLANASAPKSTTASSAASFSAAATAIAAAHILSTSTTAKSKTAPASTHCDPQVEDTNSTDSSSIDDELKKRRRKLRLPFGKKSNKSKLA